MYSQDEGESFESIPTDFQVQWPYCMSSIWVEFFLEDGREQITIMDCEFCCSPIEYQVIFPEDLSLPVQVTAKRSDG